MQMSRHRLQRLFGRLQVCRRAAVPQATDPSSAGRLACRRAERARAHPSSRPADSSSVRSSELVRRGRSSFVGATAAREHCCADPASSRAGSRRKGCLARLSRAHRRRPSRRASRRTSARCATTCCTSPGTVGISGGPPFSRARKTAGDFGSKSSSTSNCPVTKLSVASFARMPASTYCCGPIGFAATRRSARYRSSTVRSSTAGPPSSPAPACPSNGRA